MEGDMIVLYVLNMFTFIIYLIWCMFLCTRWQNLRWQFEIQKTKRRRIEDGFINQYGERVTITREVTVPT
jgi:hypothetical protein